MQGRLLDWLVQRGELNQAEAERVRREQRASRRPIRELLLERTGVSEERLLEALSAVFSLPTVCLYEREIPPELPGLLRPELLRSHTVIPFALDPADGGTLCVAMNDPMNLRGRDLVEIAARRRVRCYLATTSDILIAIDRCCGSGELLEAAARFAAPETPSAAGEDAEVSRSPVVMLVRGLLEQAVRRRASDIHIEPTAELLRVRFRVDGVLQSVGRYDLRLLSAVVARVKILSGMDIAETRRPQDGRFSIEVDRADYDIRVSVLPTACGEKCVLRLAPKQFLRRSKGSLGFTPEELRRFDHILSRPSGVVLVTGPTGSGKSTTMYAALSELNREERNIVTVEDPIESRLDGVNQVQVNPRASLSFAGALRAILRQDPDIIMIGEIRDGETADIAIKASITGHLVLSTLHTNDAASSVTRLLDMGVESYLIADAVSGIIAQRLVRRLCRHCRRAHTPTPGEAAYLGLDPETAERTELYEPAGCQRCGGSGYYERIGVYEILELTPRLREMIARRSATEELRREAMSQGMQTLSQSVRRLVLEGVTSVQEMRRVIAGDGGAPSA